MKKILPITYCTSLAGCVLLTSLNVQASPTASISIPAKPGGNFTKAEFFLHLPEGIDQFRGIYMNLPGWNSDGSKLAEDPGLRSFCKKHHLALLAATFVSNKIEGAPRETYHYAAAQSGSGEALEQALMELGQKTGHPELGEVPMLISGYSAGGMFAYGMACYRPSRIIAFAALKGGYYPSEPKAETFQVPGVIISGTLDEQRRQDALNKLFRDHRAQGSPWTLLEEPGVGHNPGQGARLVRTFFEEVLALRLPDGSSKPQAIPETKGIKVRLSDGQELSSDHPAVPLTETGWFPGQASLKIWREIAGI